MRCAKATLVSPKLKLRSSRFICRSRPVYPARKSYRQRSQTAGKQEQRAGFGYGWCVKCPDHACRFREGSGGVGVIQFSGRVGVSGCINRAGIPWVVAVVKEFAYITACHVEGHAQNIEIATGEWVTRAVGGRVPRRKKQIVVRQAGGGKGYRVRGCGGEGRNVRKRRVEAGYDTAAQSGTGSLRGSGVVSRLKRLVRVADAAR
jgi:hypothetical protein